MVVAHTVEPFAVPLARACSFPVEGLTCITLSCLYGQKDLTAEALAARVLLRSKRINDWLHCS